MRIEQSFCDLKCGHFGSAFKYRLTRNPKRIAISLLTHPIASFIAWLAALCVAVTVTAPSLKLQRNINATSTLLLFPTHRPANLAIL